MSTDVPGYVLHSVIGSGTTAQVWRAEPVGSPGRVVAVKRLAVPPEPNVVAALRREADALDRLSHPNVLRLLDVVPDGDGIALVTPLATGGSLADRISRAQGGLPVAEVADIGARIARGLAAAHDAGFVHGDVKPPNILFDAEGQPLLADLGLATLRGLPTSVAGSAGYLDPAVAVDGHAPDVPADIYALGATLFEALSSHLPVTGSDAEELLAQAAAGELPSVAGVADVPRPLAATIDRALARDPAARHASAHELAGELDEHARLLMATAFGGVAEAQDAGTGGGIEPTGPPPAPFTDRGEDRSPHGTRAFGIPAGGTGTNDDAAGETAAGDTVRGPGAGLRTAGVLGARPGSSSTRRPPRRPGARHRPGPAPGAGGPPGGTPTDTRAFGPRPPAQPAPTTPSGRRGIDRRLLIVAAVLAVVVPVAVVIWLVTGDNADPTIVAEGTTADGATGDPEPAPTDNSDTPSPQQRTPAPPCDDTDADIVAVNGAQTQLGDLAGRGCSVAVTWDGEQLTVDVPGDEPERYELSAEPDDVLVLGDLVCEGHDVPALYRPATGQLFVFEGLADHGEQITATTTDTGIRDGTPSVVRGADGCDVVEVQPR